jgi:hypothetical protein
MKIEQAITILKEHNKWRRGTPPYDEVGNRQPYSAKDIGLAIDCVVEHYDDAFIPTAESYEKGFMQGKEAGELTWHKASEELPKEDAHILFVTKTPYGNAYDVIYYPEPPITDEMDWWMEIPELPKEE